MRRIVLDTNVFIASAYNAGSASARIIEAIERGELQLILSPGILHEYARIIPRAVRTQGRIDRLRSIIAAGIQVSPPANPPVTEDREDDKFLAAALAGSAQAVITNDPHLLAVDAYLGIRVLRPSAFEQLSQNEDRDK